MAYGVRLLVTGDYACFTRPEMKVERVSYEVMTPSAARGILEAVHWKPAIRWVIDAIHVLKPIRFQSIRRNEVGHKAAVGTIKSAIKRGNLERLSLRADEDRQQRAATVLVDVAYIICAHFEMTPRAGPDDTVGKYVDVFKRRASRGQCFHQPCLGTREFAAHFELLSSGDLPQSTQKCAGLGFGQARSLGLMLWGIEHELQGQPSLFFEATLEDGVMRVPAPDSPAILR